uniref:Transferase, transferring glycosyl groups n=1 Tax=Solanum tuberosum TaxID=4113 RepID=M0ZH74_SOLTU
MWVKWFQFNTLKSMDEELAEEADSDRPKRRWLWPSTGEVFWQGFFSFSFLYHILSQALLIQYRRMRRMDL